MSVDKREMIQKQSDPSELSNFQENEMLLHLRMFRNHQSKSTCVTVLGDTCVLAKTMDTSHTIINDF